MAKQLLICSNFINCFFNSCGVGDVTLNADGFYTVFFFDIGSNLIDHFLTACESSNVTSLISKCLCHLNS